MSSGGKNQINLFVETAGPPKFGKALAVAGIWVLVALLAAVGLQVYISMESNVEKQAVTIDNATLWIGQFGMIGLIVLVAVLIMFVFAILVVVHHTKFLVADVSTFLMTMQALATSVVRKFTRFPTLGQFIKAII